MAAEPALACADAEPARIGPNALIRAAEAARARLGETETQAVFTAAGLARRLLVEPGSMVPEDEVTSLHVALRRRAGTATAREIGYEAGVRTADYLLANRIPRPVQWVLRALPAGPSARLLSKAIARHAWTFAGSGTFTVRAGRPLELSVEACPVCRGAQSGETLCDYYTGTFERLFRRLVSARADVREIACEARGEGACVFEVRW
jgi:divinyl protochlorophyllide a 8-vinyl-reductase